MAEAYLDLSVGDRREVLDVAASASGRPVHLLEKDIWVVWSLDALFNAELAAPLVFKGGTSLSKAYRLIQRFSEDVDLTFDIRTMVPDLIRGTAALPATRSQEGRWTKEIRRRLAEWVQEIAAPFLTKALEAVEPGGEIIVAGEEISVRYAPLTPGTAYVRREVTLEFGAGATGEPNLVMPIACDAAPHIHSIDFPTAEVRVMKAERTFWEKATAAHVYCRQGRLRGERYARHWYDLVCLNASGHVATAIEDSDLAQAVAAHKAMFSREKDREGNWIDYVDAVSGGLHLVPTGAALVALRDDYNQMVEDGLLIGEAASFDRLMDTCAGIAGRANANAG